MTHCLQYTETGYPIPVSPCPDLGDSSLFFRVNGKAFYKGMQVPVHPLHIQTLYFPP